MRGKDFNLRRLGHEGRQGVFYNTLIFRLVSRFNKLIGAYSFLFVTLAYTWFYAFRCSLAQFYYNANILKNRQKPSTRIIYLFILAYQKAVIGEQSRCYE